jgi:hypothetical protein
MLQHLNSLDQNGNAASGQAFSLIGHLLNAGA